MKKNLAIALAIVLVLAPAAFSHAEEESKKAEGTEKQVVTVPAQSTPQQDGGKAEPSVPKPPHKHPKDQEGC